MTTWYIRGGFVLAAFFSATTEPSPSSGRVTEGGEAGGLGAFEAMKSV
jgi:hypothetical protein